MIYPICQMSKIYFYTSFMYSQAYKKIIYVNLRYAIENIFQTDLEKKVKRVFFITRIRFLNPSFCALQRPIPVNKYLLFHLKRKYLHLFINL